MSDQHDDTASSNPAPTTNERDELVEALGRRVGAELRSPAPEHGATSIARRARGKTAAIALGAGCSALAIVAIAVFVIERRPGHEGDTRAVDVPSAPTLPPTAPQPAVPTTPVPPSTNVTSTLPPASEPPSTVEIGFVPGPAVEIEPAFGMGLPTWVYSDDGTRLYEIPGPMPDPAAWELIVRDTDTLEVIDRVACPVSTSADGASLWSAEAARAWDAQARQLFSSTSRTRNFSPFFGVGCPVVFSPDGSIAYHSLDQNDRTALWDVSAGTNIVADGHLFLDGDVAALSPDGSLLVTVDPNGLAGTRVWNARTGELLIALHGADGAPASRSSRDDNVAAQFSPDGSDLIVVGPSIEVWSVGTWTNTYAVPAECPCSLLLDDDATGVWMTADVSPDGRSMAAMQGLATTVWDLSSGAELFRFQPRIASSGATFGITSLAYSPNGRFIITELMDAHNSDESQFGEISVAIHDATTGAEVGLPQEPGSGRLPFRAALSPDGQSLALVTVARGEAGVLEYRLERWASP